MICQNCHYVFDEKQHGIDRIAHSLLNRPQGIPNGCSATVMCPRCLYYLMVKREYGAFTFNPNGTLRKRNEFTLLRPPVA
jgi:hypothetical protein